MGCSFYVPRIWLQMKKQSLFFAQGGGFDKRNKSNKISI